MMDFNNFKTEIFNDLVKIYPTARLIGDTIKISNDDVQVSIPIGTSYMSYTVNEEYKEVEESLLEAIEEALKNSTFEIDYNNVYPFIKNADFGKRDNLKFYREHFALDLDILYVSDMKESLRFVLQSDNVDFKKMREAAFNNLNRLGNILMKVDKDFEIYVLRFDSSFAAALTLSDEIQRQIKKKVGKNYLMAIPSSSTLIVAKNIQGYKDILKHIIDTESDPNKISDNIYLYKNGKYEYAEYKPCIEIVK